MKRLVLAAAVLVVVACKTEERVADTMRTDTAAPAMARMATDSAMMRDSMMRDSMMKDSMMMMNKKATKSTKSTKSTKKYP